MDPVLSHLILTLCWALREYIGLKKRKELGYQGTFYSIPPSSLDDIDTARESPKAKRRL